MKNEVLKFSQAADDSLSPAVVEPFLGRLSFERTVFQRSSPFLRHVPFLFWLIETARPTSIVELGVEDGVSFFSACQAVERLGLDTSCYGFGSWADPDISKALYDHEAKHYARLSRLAAIDLLEAAQGFAEASIDLLIINTSASEDLLACFDDWLNKLSPSAVVLLSGTGSGLAGSPERLLHERVTAENSKIALGPYGGTTAVLWGSKCNIALVESANIRFETQTYHDFHYIFARLGTAQLSEWLAQSKSAELENAKESLAKFERSLKQSEEQKTVLDADLYKLYEAYQSRSRQAAILQARLFDQQATLAAHVEERDRLAQKLDEAHANLTARTTELEMLIAQIEIYLGRISTLAQIAEEQKD